MRARGKGFISTRHIPAGEEIVWDYQVREEEWMRTRGKLPDAFPIPAHGDGDCDRAVVSDRAPPRPREHLLNAMGGNNRAPTSSEHPRAGTPRRPAATRCAESITRRRAEAGDASRTYATSAWAGTRHSAATTPRGDDDQREQHNTPTRRSQHQRARRAVPSTSSESEAEYNQRSSVLPASCVANGTEVHPTRTLIFAAEVPTSCHSYLGRAKLNIYSRTYNSFFIEVLVI